MKFILTHENEAPSKQDGVFQILALDGGGFRGLFAAKCLGLWEKSSGLRAVDCFDLITGTSTGGIIALGLGLGLPAQTLVDFYLEDGKRIFPSSTGERVYRALRRWILPKFGNKQLQHALQDRLGCSKRLGDSQTRLVIPAFDMSTRKPCFFKTDHHANYKIDWSRPAWEIAMATSAAPTYFPPFQSSWATEYADGGLWANNPAHIGVVEAINVLKLVPDNVRILNLGTGAPSAGTGKLPWKYKLGIIGWVKDASDILLDANALAISGMMERMFGDNYIRVAPALDNGKLALDSYAPEQITALAEERARYWSGAADEFFRHRAMPYRKMRPSNNRMIEKEVCA